MVLTSNEQKVHSGFWPKVTSVFASIPFAEDAVAAYYCAFDRATPLKVKGILLGALRQCRSSKGKRNRARDASISRRTRSPPS